MQDLLDHACNVVPDENLKMKCFNLVQEETEAVFDFIEKVVDPNVICHGMQVNLRNFLRFFCVKNAESEKNEVRGVCVGGDMVILFFSDTAVFSPTRFFTKSLLNPYYLALQSSYR